jgi:CHAP domain
VAIGLYATRSTAPQLTPLEQRMVTLSEGQLGYHTDPSDTYCNRFSAYWHSGTADCGNANLSEEWCADFAAWVWRESGVSFVYGLAAGDINAASISFYTWALAHGTWHPVGSGYVPRAGDVAVYGLDLTAGTAQHVAIVTSMTSGERGPNVVNGDGARTGFSVVETGTDQYKADLHGNGGLLAGYASPTRSPSPG